MTRQKRLPIGTATTYPVSEHPWAHTVDRPDFDVHVVRYHREGSVYVATLLDRDGHRFTRYADRLVASGKRAATVLSAVRSDGYMHYAVIVGRRLAINAGCCKFKSATKAIAHWKRRQRYLWAYDKTRKTYTLQSRWARSYNCPAAVSTRAHDKKLNNWSIAFVRKAERIRAKN